MAKQLNINGKSLSVFLLILLLGITGFGYWKYQDYENKLSWLESENYDLTDKIDELESERDDLHSELDDAISEKERTESLYEVMSANYDDLLETRSNYNSYNSYNSSSYGNSYSNDGADIDLPKSLSKSYLDGGYIIKPDFGNLHLLMQMSQSDFEKNMRSNNYVLTTTRESYINNDTKSVYCTIDKEWNSVAMIITDNYNSDIESFFSKNDISYKYEDGAKVYYYTFGSTSYSLLIKKSYDSFLALLKKT
ncbi:hypothetical protein [Nonlabens agnitus]|uniref:Uncharacterized protein n=1 Tax=Nonlabens agnitus TaxID=870484 RepID=A0A2S9WSB3_9FLAO|nr:hypothetical protein [Nonlabens agnitus]PRP66372.1 hypothetical protein BST86_04340 [Nonlabens agnitus]